MRLASVAEVLKERGEKPYRLGQIARAVYREGISSFLEISSLPLLLREELDAKVPILSFEPETILASKDGLTQKAVLKLRDGRRVETVLMNPKPGHWTTCISSQVGCALGCTFCATGLMGFTRDLTEEEITDQVLFWRQRIKKAGGPPLSNIVYMGMGEPFLNLDNVKASIRTLIDPHAFAFGVRHISVSTAGIAPGIESFGKEFPQVNLALSLHAATDEERTRLVPINKAYPLERLRQALKAHLERTHRKIFIEYTLLQGENDSLAQAETLARFLKTIGPIQLLHVNLIVWNPTDTPHHATKVEAARAFKEALRKHGLPTTIRKNLGQDIQGACGQLVVEAGKKKEPKGKSSV